MRSERKSNLIKALKRENTHLKRKYELLGCEPDIEQKRASFMISKRFKKIYGEQMIQNIVKNEIGHQLRAFLDEVDIKVEDCGATKRYIFDFWAE